MFTPPEQIFITEKPGNLPVFIYHGQKITWDMFCTNISLLADEINAKPKSECLLYCEDSFLFAIGFFALLQANKTITLLHNVQEATVKEFSNADNFLLTDLNSVPDIPAVKIIYKDNIRDYSYRLNTIKNTAPINFLTSGSTEKPKTVYKTILQLSNEVLGLENLWGDARQRFIVSTVSHQHVYGLLFKILWPLCRGDLIYSTLVFTPEEVSKLSSGEENIYLVSSPAFLKRVTNGGGNIKTNSVITVFSSGGVLPENAATASEKLFSCQITEILGSTETGGIAHRNQKTSSAWRVFDNVLVDCRNDQLFVKSPYIYSDDFIATGDTVELIDTSHFILKERTGRIVKVEEKRISLSEIESRLEECALVKNCYTLILEGKRQIIGAVVVLTNDGHKILNDSGKNHLNIILRKHLSRYFEAVVIPRKWRYVDDIKTNSQGKISYNEMARLFD